MPAGIGNALLALARLRLQEVRRHRGALSNAFLEMPIALLALLARGLCSSDQLG
jgi:hypothetical protein